MSDQWDVVCNDDLHPAILAGTSDLIQGWFPDAASPVVSAADLQWKLGDANPAGRGFMTVAMVGDRIVGSITCTRKRWRLGDRELAVAEIGDSFTAREYLKAGSAKQPWIDESDPERQQYLSRSVFGRVVTETLSRADASGVELVFGVANEVAARGYVRHLGFQTWDHPRLTTYARPGAGVYAARAKIPRSAGAFVDRLAARCTQLASGARGLRVAEGDLSSDLAEIDDVWKRAPVREGAEPVRDARWVRWRFREHASARYRLWLVRDAHRLRGWYVTRSDRNPVGVAEVHVADWCFDGSTPLAAIMAEVAIREGGPDVDRYALWCQDRWRPSSRVAGMVLETYHPGLIVRRSPSASSDLSAVRGVGVTTATSDNI